MKHSVCIFPKKNIYLEYLLKASSCDQDAKFQGVGGFKNDLVLNFQVRVCELHKTGLAALYKYIHSSAA